MKRIIEMARARNIKPSFFKNERLVELDFWIRLLFIGLWTMADREGRLEDRPKKVKMELFPADDVDVEKGLQALHENGFIFRYQLCEHQYIQIITFKEHQNPHVKEAASTIPAPGQHSANTIRATLNPESLLLNPESLNDPPLVDQGAEHAPPDCPHKEIVALYHEILPMCPKVEVWNKTRAGYLRQRWKESPSLEEWRAYFEHVSQSKFLTGRVNGSKERPPFVASLEWLIRPENFANVIEGKYHRGK